MAIDLPAILSQLHWLSDFSSSMVLAEAWVGLPGHHVMTVSGSGQTSFSTIGMEVLTAALPGHRELWLAAPTAMAMCGSALLALATWRLGGAWAGIMTLAISICAAPVLLEVLVGQNDHGVTLFNVELLAVLLVLAYSAPWRRGLLLAGGAILGGAVTGINLASDLLLGVNGLVPFVLAPVLLLALRRNRRNALLAGWSVTLVAVATGSSLAFGRLMRHFGIIVAPGVPLQVASIEGAWTNASILVAQTLEMGNGNVIGRPLGVALLPTLVLAATTTIAVAVVLARPALVLRRRGPSTPASPDAELVFVTYWAVAVGALGVGFIISTFPMGPSAVRYLGVVFLAVAACLPLWARGSRARQAGLALGATLFCAGSAWSVHQRTEQEAFRPPHTRDLPQVIALLDQQGLHRGYSTYWDANAVTWQTSGRIHVVGVAENPTNIVRFPPNSIDAWYDGSASGPTFILIDPQMDFMAEVPGRRLGPPDRVYAVGRFTVLVYPGDVASQFAR